MATNRPSRTALTRITDDSGEWRAALVSRFTSTCTMRRRSAATNGRSGSTSISRWFRPPAFLKAFLARSTSAAASAGSGLTGSAPVSMRATSSRSDTRAFMWSAWSRMIRTNWRTTAGSRSATESRIVVADPLMEVRGILSSWLTMARNSARSRSGSLTSAMSWRVTTIDSMTPSPETMGVAFSSRVRLRPSGTLMTTSSARTVSPDCSASATGNSISETTRPSALLKVTTSSRSSSGWSGPRSPSTIRRASRLKDLGRPVAASKTATPTGEVSTRVSRSFLALCSSR